jgi:putative serine/threonine protein kinase
MNLKEFLARKKLFLVRKISKGYSSEVFLAENSKGKKFCLKVEKEKSPRMGFLVKETENLKAANSVGVGPKLIDYDVESKAVLMEYIEGVTFEKYLFETNVSKQKLLKLIKELLKQGRKLDKIGLDHGQLGGVGRNILVRKNLPIIIDFEKGSQVRKTHNLGRLKSFLFLNPHSSISKRVKEILGEKWKEILEQREIWAA